MKSKQAFTLLEIIMTLVLSAVLLGAISTFFSGAVRLRDSGTVRMDALPARERTMNILRSDLSHLILADNKITGSLVGDPQGVNSKYPGSLSLTTTAFRSNGNADVIEVTYAIEEDDAEDSDGSGMLLREANPHLLAVQDQEPVTEVLLRGVQGMELGFWDGDQWLDSWDADHSTNAPPAAVRVKIIFTESEQALNDAIEVLAPVMMTPRSSEEEEEES